MLLVDYDPAERASTIRIDDQDLSLIVSVLGGLVASWSTQDPAILGLSKSRLESLEREVRRVFLSGSSADR